MTAPFSRTVFGLTPVFGFFLASALTAQDQPRRSLLFDGRGLAFTSDGHLVLTWKEGVKPNVFVWDAASITNPQRRPLRTLTIDGTLLGTSPDGSVLISHLHFPSGGQAVRTWNAETGSPIAQYANATHMILSADNRIGVVKSSSGGLIVDANAGAPVSTIASFANWDVSPDNTYVLASTYDQYGLGGFNLIDIDGGRPIWSNPRGPRGHDLSVLSFSHDGSFFLAGFRGGGWQTSDLVMWGFSARGTPIRVLGTPAIPDQLGGVTAASLSPDDRWIAAGYYKGNAFVWDAFTGAVACRLGELGSSGSILSMRWSPNTQWLAIQNSENAQLIPVRQCLVEYLHGSEIRQALARSPLFAPKGEFETSAQYAERLAAAKTMYTQLITKYETSFDDEMRAEEARRKAAILKSTAPATLRIDSLGTYDADRQVFPVSIGGSTDVVRIPLEEAQTFKQAYVRAKVSGIRRLMKDLQSSELVNIEIVHPIAGATYQFGRQVFGVRSAGSPTSPGTPPSIARAPVANTNPGGMHLELELDQYMKVAANPADIQSAVNVLRKRLAAFGATQPSVEQLGSDRIVVKLAAVTDPARAKTIIQRRAFLEFRIADRTGALEKALPSMDRALQALLKPSLAVGFVGLPGEFAVSEEAYPRVDSMLWSPAIKAIWPRNVEFFWMANPLEMGGTLYRLLYVVEVEAIVTGTNLVDAKALTDPATNEPVIRFELDQAGARRFGEGTGRHIGDYLTTILDGRVYGRPPIIRSRIDGNWMFPLGNRSLEETQDLALILKAGALPLPLKIVLQRQ